MLPVFLQQKMAAAEQYLSLVFGIKDPSWHAISVPRLKAVTSQLPSPHSLRPHRSIQGVTFAKASRSVSGLVEGGWRCMGDWECTVILDNEAMRTETMWVPFGIEALRAFDRVDGLA